MYTTPPTHRARMRTSLTMFGDALSAHSKITLRSSLVDHVREALKDLPDDARQVLADALANDNPVGDALRGVAEQARQGVAQ